MVVMGVCDGGGWSFSDQVPIRRLVCRSGTLYIVVSAFFFYHRRPCPPLSPSNKATTDFSAVLCLALSRPRVSGREPPHITYASGINIEFVNWLTLTPRAKEPRKGETRKFQKSFPVQNHGCEKDYKSEDYIRSL